MNLDNIDKANELIDESIRLFKKAITEQKRGTDPKEIDKKYVSIARQKRQEGFDLLWG